MVDSTSEDRWLNAQKSEAGYWQGMSTDELLRICSEKPPFLSLVADFAPSLFDDREVLEIGCGPCAISLASFYKNSAAIKRLVKIEPLPRFELSRLTHSGSNAEVKFLAWIEELSDQGEYVTTSGETFNSAASFDTVIIYNVLDHVQDPLSILKNAYAALRHGGKVLIGVDCRSVIGKLKFQLVTRRTHKDSILVQAHPFTFLVSDVIKLIKEAGFQEVECRATGNLSSRLWGKMIRPAFIGKKGNKV